MELKELMALVDMLAGTEADRLALDRRSKELKKIEDDFRATIIKEMQYLGLTSINGHSGRIANTKTSVEPVVVDWPTTLQYIRETGNLDLLHKRLTASAVKLRWADGVMVPGVDQYEETKLVLS